MEDFVDQLLYFLSLMKANTSMALLFVSSVWIVFIVNILVGRRLFILGIYPRSLTGLIGIPCSPFLHGNFNHLFFNSIPLLVLINFILIDGIHVFIRVSIIIILLSGLAVWLFGRKAIHIGASSLIMGYFSYLLVNAYQHPSVSSIILAIICVYYFGGLVFDLFPREEKVSWEGHVFGFLAGLAAVYL